MDAHVHEVSVCADSGALYIVVGVPELGLINDFIFDVQPVGERIALDKQGRASPATGGPPVVLTPDTVEPPGGWRRETVERDMRALVRQSIDAWLERAIERGDSGDKRSPVVRGQADPRGMLPRVSGLLGEVRSR